MLNTLTISPNPFLTSTKSPPILKSTPPFPTPRFSPRLRTAPPLPPLVASLRSGEPLRYRDGRDERDQFVEALLLVPETARHYKMWKQGFGEEAKLNWPGHNLQLRNQVKGPKMNGETIDHGFLHRFKNPTIFLRILCDGDILLPIAVGDFAIARLIDNSNNDQHEESSDLYECLEDMMEKLAYEVKLVCLTKKVSSTYHARILLGKSVERATMNLDARPSDALILAKRFKVPILVSKEIVLKDAIRSVRGTEIRSSKSIYDVEWDSAPEGSDPVSEELDLLRKMNTAVMEERYQDAAIWRDKLYKFRELRS